MSAACRLYITCKDVLLRLRMLRLLQLLLLLGSLLPGVCGLQLPQQLGTVCRGRLWLLLVLYMLCALHMCQLISCNSDVSHMSPSLQADSWSDIP